MAMETEPKPEVAVLSQEERLDLRRRVLAGESLSLDQARQVIDSLRHGQGVAILSQENKPKKGGSKKPALSDDALDADLADLGL